MPWETRNLVDVAVIGSGAAGLTYALEISRSLQVLLLTKDRISEGNTRYAQGGIAAVLKVDDSYERHIADTLAAGAGMCDEEAVKVLVREAPARIRDLMFAGVAFDASREGGLDLTREGGHSGRRILHVGDLTGKAIEEALVKGVTGSPHIEIREHVLGLDLLVRDGVCYGLTYLDESGTVQRVFAKVIVLATGGAGQLFSRNTNPEVATGDGFTMAWRAGAVMENMEYIQFHPTAFCKQGAPTFLITEAVRGEGGILLNSRGERFMEGVHPYKELAPRDIVARAIYRQMTEFGEPFVLLDMTAKPADWVQHRFPFVYQECLKYGVDITRQPIPVAPAAHYCCGGVKTDIDGRTSLQGLYVCGEAACTGVHGANRLASNSLLESVVFAYRAAVHSDRYVRYLPAKWFETTAELARSEVPFRGEEGPVPDHTVKALRRELQSVLWLRAGIVRTDAGLRAGLSRVKDLVEEIEKLWATHAPSFGLAEARNLAECGKLVLSAALERRFNAGAHYNVDLENGEQ